MLIIPMMRILFFHNRYQQAGGEEGSDSSCLCEPEIVLCALKRREHGFEQVHIGIVAADTSRVRSESARARAIEVAFNISVAVH